MNALVYDKGNIGKELVFSKNDEEISKRFQELKKKYNTPILKKTKKNIIIKDRVFGFNFKLTEQAFFIVVLIKLFDIKNANRTIITNMAQLIFRDIGNILWIDERFPIYRKLETERVLSKSFNIEKVKNTCKKATIDFFGTQNSFQLIKCIDDINIKEIERHLNNLKRSDKE